jgi:hypothetical protein
MYLPRDAAKVGSMHSLRMPACGRGILGSLLLIVSTLGHAVSPANAEGPNGYALSDSAITTYFHQHGGAAGLGNPISNPMKLLGRRVQLFQRLPLEVEPDGSVRPLDLLDGDVLPPLTAVAGPGMAPDPILSARIPSPGSAHYRDLASAYLDSAAPNSWNSQPVRFGFAFRSMLRCADLALAASCDRATLLDAATDLWGLPTASPFADPRAPDYVYLRFQRGVMVYSASAGDTQWLLLGELFKQVLLGGALPPDMLAQIGASASLARFYAQYDPLARQSVARPDELAATSLSGAFSPASATIPTADAPADLSAASAVAPVALMTPRPQLDSRFGVAEGFQNPGLMAELHAGWERVVLPWDQIQPDGPGDFSHLGMTLSADRLRTEVGRGIHVAGVFQFTPGWAQSNTAAGLRSVPKNLDLPFDDPQNYWGRFVYETVRWYAGQIDEWVIWNEPDFRPGDAGGGAYSWAGSDEEFARLLAVGYQAAKKANPAAVVSFPATSYWVEEISNPKRTPFYERLLRLLTADPGAVAHNLYHDAVALNLYRSPDDVYRVHSVFATIQHRFGIERPIWLTEMNAMPSDDSQTSCPDHQAVAGMKVSLDQQAAFAIQSFALAAAAGYQHAEFYSMSDANTCQYPPWGLARTDGTRRPVAEAVRTALSYFSHFTAVHFMPLVRPLEAWPAWPNSPNSYVPNWQVYQIAFDRPQNQRVTALWNDDGNLLRVRVPKNGASARVVDRHGVEHNAREEGGTWIVELPAATAGVALDEANKDPEGYHVIGGDPVLLVEEAVDPGAAVVPPQLIGS